MNARSILLATLLTAAATGCVAYAQPYPPPPPPPDQGGYPPPPDSGYQDQGYPDQGYQDQGYQDQGYQDQGYGPNDQGYDQSYYDQGYNGQPVSVDFFYQQLAPYGRWVQVANYGWAWHPSRISAGWRPYRYGRWVYTEYGWTWVSQEPFGWATYHYGRWALDPQYGWVWVPGTDWGPAWVAWQEGAGYIGWAPLPPSVRFQVGIGLDLGGLNLAVSLGPSWFSFVPERSFLAPSIATYVLPPQQNVVIIRNTRNITNYRWANNRVVNQSVPVQRIQQVTGQRVRQYRVAEAPRPSAGQRPRITGDQVTIFRPRVSTSRPAMTPQQAIAQRAPLARRGPANVQPRPGTQTEPAPGTTARRPAPQPRQPFYGGSQTDRTGRTAPPPAGTPEQQDLARQRAEQQRQRRQPVTQGTETEGQQPPPRGVRRGQQEQPPGVRRGQEQPPPGVRRGQEQQPPPQNARGQEQREQQPPQGQGRQNTNNRNKDKNKNRDNRDRGNQNDDQKPPPRR